MLISEIRLTRIEVPLRHIYVGSRGVKRSYFKTIAHLTAEDGTVGVGETDGSEEVFRRASALAPLLQSLRLAPDGPPDLSVFKMFRAAPVADRVAIGGLEMACWDLIGKKLGEPLCRLLGGPHRDEVEMVCEFSAGHFGSDATASDIETYFADLGNVGPLVEAVEAVVARDGYETVKLKSIGRSPEWDILAMERLRARLGPRFRLRHDPNGAYPVEEAARLCRQLDDLGLQWFEDPTSGLEGLLEVRRQIDTPVATNMWAISFDETRRALELEALDIVGIDPFHWAGLANAHEAAAFCQANGLGIFLHCFFDLGITTAAMLHLAASIPDLPSGMDTCLYLQGTDIIEGGEMTVKKGKLRVPTGPGLGVVVDENLLKRYRLGALDLSFR